MAGRRTDGKRKRRPAAADAASDRHRAAREAYETEGRLLPEALERDASSGVAIDRLGHQRPIFEQTRKGVFERIKPGLIDSEQGTAVAWRNMEGTSLARLLRRGSIAMEQYLAGERYFEAWWLSGIDQRVTGRYGEGAGGGEATYGMPVTEIAARFRAELRSARSALMTGLPAYPARLRWAIVEDVAVRDATAYDVGARLGHGGRTASRHGMEALQAGLDVLVEHFGLRSGGRRGSGRLTSTGPAFTDEQLRNYEPPKEGVRRPRWHGRKGKKDET